MDYSSKVGDGTIVRNNLEEIILKVDCFYVTDKNTTVQEAPNHETFDTNEALAGLCSLKRAEISLATRRGFSDSTHLINISSVMLEQQDDGTLAPKLDFSISSPKKVIFGVRQYL